MRPYQPHKKVEPCSERQDNVRVAPKMQRNNSVDYVRRRIESNNSIDNSRRSR